MKYRVEREIRVVVYDYVEADSEEQAIEKANDLPSLIGEISKGGLSEHHASVSYNRYDEQVRKCHKNLE